jgi:probable phosphoglycerate mutase
MTKIFMIRHGETLFNIEKRMQGWCDSPLTNKGVLQAKALHNILLDIPFVRAYASSSERAIDTANYILEGRDVQLVISKKLKERNFGILEGTRQSAWNDRNGNDGEFVLSNIIHRMQKGFDEYGGESYDIFIKRLMDSLREIVQECPAGNVLVVSHAGAILATVFHLLDGKGMDEYGPLENCSLTVLEYDGSQFQVAEYNRKIDLLGEDE